VTKYQPAQIRERCGTAVSLLRQLQSDFRAVEESFREITLQVQQRQVEGQDTRGGILEFALDAGDVLKQEDQGVSFGRQGLLERTLGRGLASEFLTKQLMTEWLYHLPVVWMALVIFSATYAITWGIHRVVMRLSRGARAATCRRIATGILSPLGTIFGLLGGFLAVQVWNDYQRANDQVNREANALRAAVILAQTLPAQTETRIRALVAQHVQKAITAEWPAMERQSAGVTDPQAALIEALQLTLTDNADTEGTRIAQREIVRWLQDALDARRQRVIISRSSINWVKWTGLVLQAMLVLITIGLVHCENPDTAAVAMGIFASAVATSALLIASHTRPFTGEISVSPEVLREVMPSTGATAHP
jgi:hypothetical protein